MTALTQYDPQFLLCRWGNLGHSWFELCYFRDGPVVKRQLSCDRCGSMRIDRWKPTGERIASRYIYSGGYLLPGEHVTPQDVRVEVLHRVTVYDNEEAMLDALFPHPKTKKKR